MTPAIAITTTHWLRVAAKAGAAGVTACECDAQGRGAAAGRGVAVLVRHGKRRQVFDPAQDEWLTAVIMWLREGGE